MYSDKSQFMIRRTYRVNLQGSRIRQASCLFHIDFLLGLLFAPENGNDILSQNVAQLSADYKKLYPRRQNGRVKYVRNLKKKID
jgi:hypothetical protein